MTDRPSALPAAPAATSEGTRRSMVANRGRDTGPELALRRLLHARGMRYRVDVAPVRGVRRRADVVFPRQRVAVFVDGCFWHRCPEHGTLPRRNADYWVPKLQRNVERDRDTDARLADAGWRVLRVWEHVPPAEAADLVERAVRGAPAGE